MTETWRKLKHGNCTICYGRETMRMKQADGSFKLVPCNCVVRMQHKEVERKGATHTG